MSLPIRRFLSAGVAVAVTALTLVAADRPPALSTVIVRPDATPPVLPGDVFDFASASTTTITLTGVKPIVEKTTFDYTIKASGPATFDHRTKLTKLAYTFPVGNATLSDDEYVGFVAGDGAMEEVLYGVTTSTKDVTPTGTESGTSTQTFPAGGIESVFPEVAGQHWSPAATSTTVSDLTGKSAGDKLTETEFADGSLTSDDVATEGSSKVTTVKTIAANGTGKLDETITGFNPETVSVGLPAVQHSKTVIPVTTAGGNALPAKPAPAMTIEVPDWYPSHDAPPKPLYSAEVTDKGLVSAPAACGKRAGTKAFDLHGESTKLDPVAASYTTTVEDEYDAAGLGPICSTEKFETYNYSELAFETGKVISSVVTSDVSILTSESGPKPLFGVVGGAQPFSLGFGFPGRLQPLRATAPAGRP
jgi:hypothetical protein